jgi:hypothetical protein
LTAAGLGLVAGAGAAGTAAASTVEATAVSSAHWRIVARTDSTLSTIVAPARSSAWALGSKTGSGSSVLPAGVTWNGRRWNPVSFPKSVTSGIACSGASSPDNVWAFAGSSLYGNFASYAGALRLDGAKWMVKKAFVPPGIVSGCTVLSATNAWVYGLSHVAPGVGTWRLRGSTWRPAKTGTFALISASEVSARDIWATAADQAGGNDVVAHWTGHSWQPDRSVAAALPAQSSKLMWGFSAITAVSAGNVFLAGQLQREDSHGNWHSSPFVLHRIGGSWLRVGPVNPGYYLPGAVSDGHGGWWSQGTGLEFGFGIPSAKPYLLHYSLGLWHRVTIAAPKGYKMQIMDVAHVPGSDAMLAVASLFNGKPGLHSVVLAYGSLPK